MPRLEKTARRGAPGVAKVFVMKKGGRQDREVERRLLTDRRCGCAEVRELAKNSKR